MKRLFAFCLTVIVTLSAMAFTAAPVRANDWTLTEQEILLRAEGDKLFEEFLAHAEFMFHPVYDDVWERLPRPNGIGTLFTSQALSGSTFTPDIQEQITDGKNTSLVSGIETISLLFYSNMCYWVQSNNPMAYLETEDKYVEKTRRNIGYENFSNKKYYGSNFPVELEKPLENFKTAIDNINRWQYRYFYATGDVYNFVTKDSLLKRDGAVVDISNSLLADIAEKQRKQEAEDRILEARMNDGEDEIDPELRALIDEAVSELSETQEPAPIISPALPTDEELQAVQAAAAESERSLARKLIDALGYSIISVVIGGALFGVVFYMKRGRKDKIDLSGIDDE